MSIETEKSATTELKKKSGIVDAICRALNEHGYETDQAVGESAYKVDIGVVDPKDPDKYLLGILLDGTGYETAKTTRDREIAQINVLQGLGWTITRIWSMDWWDNSKKEITRILNEISSAEQKKEQSEEQNKEEHKGSIIDPSTQQKESVSAEQTSLFDEQDSPKPLYQEKTEPTPAPIETDDGIQLKGVIRNTTIEKKPVLPYKTAFLLNTYMTADDFITPVRSHNNDVARKVLAVLEVESPINENLLTRRVVQSCFIARAGSRIQAYMYGIYRALKLNYTMQGGERFYWIQSQDPRTYREFRANGPGDNKRDAKEIPVQEAANAVCRALEEQFSLPQEDLIRAAANLMGISRIGNSVNALFMGGIHLAEDDARIKKTDNGNWMLAE